MPLTAPFTHIEWRLGRRHPRLRELRTQFSTSSEMKLQLSCQPKALFRERTISWPWHPAKGLTPAWRQSWAPPCEATLRGHAGGRAFWKEKKALTLARPCRGTDSRPIAQRATPHFVARGRLFGEALTPQNCKKGTIDESMLSHDWPDVKNRKWETWCGKSPWTVCRPRQRISQRIKQQDVGNRMWGTWCGKPDVICIALTCCCNPFIHKVELVLYGYYPTVG